MAYYRNTLKFDIRAELFGVGLVLIPAGMSVDLPEHIARVINDMSSPNTPLVPAKLEPAFTPPPVKLPKGKFLKSPDIIIPEEPDAPTEGEPLEV